MTRLPVVLSFALFLALAASLAYWLVQWTAPVPRAVSALPKNERSVFPVSAAASLFGGRSQEASMAHVQLRGVVHSGRSSDSVAIIAVEGKPPRAIRVNSEIAPGVKVKQILKKTVVVSEQGAERELRLPAFAAQESSAAAVQPAAPPPVNALPANPPTAMSPGPISSSGGPGAGTQGGSALQGGGMVAPLPTRNDRSP